MKRTAKNSGFYALAAMTICGGLGTLGMSADPMNGLAEANRAPKLTRIALQDATESNTDKVVCASASDIDGHAVHFEWILVGSDAPTEGLQVVASHKIANEHTECVSVVLSAGGRYELQVAAFDGVQDPRSGHLVFIEDYFAGQGLDINSHDELSFPLVADRLARR